MSGASWSSNSKSEADSLVMLDPIGQTPRLPPAEVGYPIDTLVGDWWVVHTKARNEKALGSDLEKLGIGYFLPLARVKRKYGRRRLLVEIPLFPSYLFMCGGRDERSETLGTHRAASVIQVFDQRELKEQLRQIHRVTTSGKPVDLYPGLKRGSHCRVIRGCLKGLEGVVLRRRGTCRIYVAVEALGQSAELEIDADLLEAIN